MVQVLQVQGVFVSRDQMRAFVIQDALRDPTEHTLYIWRKGGEVLIRESDSREATIVTLWRSANPTWCVFGCGELNRPSKEEVKVVDKRHLIWTNHTVGYTTASSTSHTT